MQTDNAPRAAETLFAADADINMAPPSAPPRAPEDLVDDLAEPADVFERW